MAANWLRINGSEYINASQVRKIKFIKSKNQYELTMTDKTTLAADVVEHATTFDITDEKEITSESIASM